MVAFVANPNRLRLWLDDELTKAGIIGAYVAVTVIDAKSEEEVAGVTWPQIMINSGDPNEYRAVFGRDLEAVSGRKLVAVIDAWSEEGGPDLGHWEFEFVPKTRRF